jgi:hypothetical protein
MVDVDGPPESDIPMPEEDDEDVECAYRACPQIRRACPARTDKAGFALHKRDGAIASADDLEQTITGSGPLVSDG